MACQRIVVEVMGAGIWGPSPSTIRSMPSHDEVVRLYGPWEHRTPQDAAAFLDGYTRHWWIAGGWAIDAFTKTSRVHGDLDIGVPRTDLEDFIEFVSPHLDVWAAAGSLTPIFPGRRTQIPSQCSNLWLRTSGADPWQYDVMLENVQDETWIYKRDSNVTRPLADCLWTENGITYLRPEIQLLLKAKHPRPKDTEDFERCLPRLETTSRTWLTQKLLAERPHHPWLKQLS